VQLLSELLNAVQTEQQQLAQLDFIMHQEHAQHVEQDNGHAHQHQQLHHVLKLVPHNIHMQLEHVPQLQQQIQLYSLDQQQEHSQL